ncbi:M48 family metalloprotease [Desulfovibrio aerotolerans]|uniref:M48 family metalloprotease n=1 Tax=Solidesulfovibrio aerotolerans TaxID=295255 RepID=A0A7C9J909_9BACT|nr:M48 family metallopeptidase [Solidesulfovibrio aerotolerans]MYL83198.1 M48 family metalloprotease [Solidesulfovibrio aerotolerans]
MYVPSLRHRPGATRRLAAAAAAVWLAVSLVLAPTAQASFFSFDLKDERELGEKFNTLIRARMPLIEDTEINDYISGVVERIVKVMPPQPFPFNVAIINNNAVNAFAGPAGYVFVFTGLILQMEHESEIAGVVAHELAHVSQRHIAKRVGEMKMLSIGQLVGVLAGAVLGQATGNQDLGTLMAVGSQAATAHAYLKYSRDDEREADQVGMNYLVAAGYSPQGLVEAFETMRKLKFMQGGGDIPTYLSTHPGLNERMAYLKDRVKMLPKDVQDRKDQDAAFKRAQVLVRARYTDPKNAVAYFRKIGDKATCLDKLGLAIALSRSLEDMSQAKAAFDAALACGGTDPLVLRESGRYYLKIRDFARAKTLLEAALRQNPGDIDSNFEYGRMLAQEGNPKAAISYMEKVRLRVPENGEIRAIYGQILGQAGDIFHAYLNLTYAAVYENNPMQVKFQLEKTKAAAKTDDDRRELAKLQAAIEKRAEFWKKKILN